MTTDEKLYYPFLNKLDLDVKLMGLNTLDPINELDALKGSLAKWHPLAPAKRYYPCWLCYWYVDRDCIEDTEDVKRCGECFLVENGKTCINNTGHDYQIFCGARDLSDDPVLATHMSNKIFQKLLKKYEELIKEETDADMQ